MSSSNLSLNGIITPSLLPLNKTDFFSFGCIFPLFSSSPENTLFEYKHVIYKILLYLLTYKSANNKVITKVSAIPINKIFALNIMILDSITPPESDYHFFNTIIEKNCIVWFINKKIGM